MSRTGRRDGNARPPTCSLFPGAAAPHFAGSRAGASCTAAERTGALDGHEGGQGRARGLLYLRQGEAVSTRRCATSGGAARRRSYGSTGCAWSRPTKSRHRQDSAPARHVGTSTSRDGGTAQSPRCRTDLGRHAASRCCQPRFGRGPRRSMARLREPRSARRRSCSGGIFRRGSCWQVGQARRFVGSGAAWCRPTTVGPERGDEALDSSCGVGWEVEGGDASVRRTAMGQRRVSPIADPGHLAH